MISYSILSFMNSFRSSFANDSRKFLSLVGTISESRCILRVVGDDWSLMDILEFLLVELSLWSNIDRAPICWWASVIEEWVTIWKKIGSDSWILFAVNAFYINFK